MNREQIESINEIKGRRYSPLLHSYLKRDSKFRGEVRESGEGLVCYSEDGVFLCGGGGGLLAF